MIFYLLIEGLCQPTPRLTLLLPSQRLWSTFLFTSSLCPTHHIHRPLVPGIQAAAWSHCWKWPPNRCAFNLFPGHWPLCPKEAASQAGGPKIAVYVCPWMGLSITARPLPPDASSWWLALIGPLGVGQGSWFCPLGLWPLKGPIVTTWKGESALILGQPESPSYKEAERFVEVLPCRLCVARDDGLFHNSLVRLFFGYSSLKYMYACVLHMGMYT